MAQFPGHYVPGMSVHIGSLGPNPSPGKFWGCNPDQVPVTDPAATPGTTRPHHPAQTRRPAMTRHAVEDFTTPAPLVADVHSDDHPYNRGLIVAYAGRDLAVYMMTEAPGEFFLDEMRKRPATDEQAKAAFGIDAVAKYRHQAREVAANRRIEQALAQSAEPAPEVTELERKKLLARKLIREYEKRVQHEADLAVTRDLGLDVPA
jgi:hypothetical protein